MKLLSAQIMRLPAIAMARWQRSAIAILSTARIRVEREIRCVYPTEDISHGRLEIDSRRASGLAKRTNRLHQL